MNYPKTSTLDYIIESLNDYVGFHSYGLINWHDLIKSKIKLLIELDDDRLNNVISELQALTDDTWCENIVSVIDSLEHINTLFRLD